MRVRQAAKRDANEDSIVQALRAAGVSVERLNGVSGLADLLCGHRGVNRLVEVKTARGKLTRDQKQWLGRWNGEGVFIVRSVSEALALFGVQG